MSTVAAARFATPSRPALALLALFATLPPTLRADDCISSPIDGIFCSDDENADYEVVNVTGTQSATWTADAMVFDRTYYYVLDPGSTLQVTAAAADYYQAKVFVSGSGEFHLVGGHLRSRSFGAFSGAFHLTDSHFAGTLYDIGGDWQNDAVFHITDSTFRLERSVSYGSSPILPNALVLSGSARIETVTGGYFNPGDIYVTANNTLSGDGTLVKAGAGHLILSASNTYSGGTRIEHGNLEVFADANFGAADSSVTFAADTGLWLNDGFASSARPATLENGLAYVGVRSGSASWNGAISGEGGLVKTGAGTLTPTADNTYAGGTTVAAGTLAISADARLGAAGTSVTLGAGATLSATAGFASSARPLTLSGASANIHVPGAADTLTWNGVVSGPGRLVKKGSGTLGLSQANTFAGGLRVEAGAVEFASDSALGASGSGVVLHDGTTLRATAGFTSSARPLHIASGSASFDVPAAAATVVWTGDLSGDGAFDKTGDGVFTLSGANTAAGGLVVSAGTFRLGADQAAGSGPLTIHATLDLDGFSQTTSSIASSGSGAIALGGGSLTYELAEDATLPVTLSGSGAFTKSGAATLTLGAANAFSGTASVTAGTLLLDHAQALGSATVGTSGSGSLSFGALTAATFGGLSGSGPLALQNASAQALALTLDTSANSTYSGALSGPGSLVKTGAATFTLSGAASHSGYTTIREGTLKTGAANVLSPDSALFLIGGSTLDLDGHDQTVGDLDSYNLAAGFVEASTVNLGGATLTNLTRVINLWAGNLSGTGTLVKKGPAEMKWYAANTFSGTLRIDTGIVSAQNPGVFSPNAAVQLGAGTTLALNNHAQTIAGLSGPAGSVTLGSATLTVAQATDTSFAGAISGTGALVKSGSGTLTLSGANTFSGGLTLKGGALSAAADSALGAADARVDLDGGALRSTASFTANRATTIGPAGGAFDVAASSTLTWSGALDGSGALAKTGAGLLALTGDASGFSGDTSVAAGTLRFRGALGSGSFAVSSGATLDLQAAGIDLSRLSGAGSVIGTADFLSTSASDRAVATRLGGSGALRHSGAGTLVLSGENHYTGGTTLSAGVVSIAADSALGDAYGVLSFEGGALETTATLESARSIDLSGSGTVRTAADTTLAGEIFGKGALVKTGAATLTLAGDNTYSGGTTIQAGTLRAGHVNAFGGGDVEIVAGTVDFAGFAIANAILNRGGTLTGLAAYAGTQTIAANASFSGTVGGSVIVADAAALDTTGATFTGPVTVEVGGTLTGTGTLGTLTVAAGGVLSPGNSPGLLTIGDGSILEGTTLIELGGLDRGDAYDAIDVLGPVDGLGSVTVGGTLQIVFWNGWTPAGEASFQIFRASSIGGTFAQIDLPALAAGYEWDRSRLLSDGLLDIVVAAIPEPAAAASLAGLALLGFAATRRRRK